MAHAYDSKQGAAYLINPLTEPEPSEETGLNSHFRSTMPPATDKPKSPTSKKPVATATAIPTSPTSSNNPYRKTSTSSSHGGHSRGASRDFTTGSPSGSPKAFPNYREAAFGDMNDNRRRSGSGSGDRPSSSGEHTRHRRTSSLTPRYPGDNSHTPLEVIRRDSKKANRSPHLQRRHIPGADSIDRLDPTLNSVPYHHEGPYDAALLARNTSFETSPVAAVADSNREALKATPAENIRDAIERHQPIEGVASVPPGEPDRLGRVYHYEEGTDLMRDPNAPGGPYKQWAGVDYDRDDIKGKGQPGFSLDRALQAHTIQERDFDGERGIEMADRRRSVNNKSMDARDPIEIAGGERQYGDLHDQLEVGNHASGSSSNNHDVNRTSSLRKAGEGIKKRLSIKKKFRQIHDGEVD